MNEWCSNCDHLCEDDNSCDIHPLIYTIRGHIPKMVAIAIGFPEVTWCEHWKLKTPIPNIITHRDIAARV